MTTICAEGKWKFTGKHSFSQHELTVHLKCAFPLMVAQFGTIVDDFSTRICFSLREATKARSLSLEGASL